jgi:hypothetical protein
MGIIPSVDYRSFDVKREGWLLEIRRIHHSEGGPQTAGRPTELKP